MGLICLDQIAHPHSHRTTSRKMFSQSEYLVNITYTVEIGLIKLLRSSCTTSKPSGSRSPLKSDNVNGLLHFSLFESFCFVQCLMFMNAYLTGSRRGLAFTKVVVNKTSMLLNRQIIILKLVQLNLKIQIQIQIQIQN